MSNEEFIPEEQIKKLKQHHSLKKEDGVQEVFSSLDKTTETPEEEAESSTSSTEKTPKKRKWKLIVAIVVLALIVVGITAWFTFEQIRNTHIEPEVQEEIIREMPDPVEVEPGENPFAAMLAEEDKEYSGPGNSSIVKDGEEETFTFESTGTTLAPVNVDTFEPAVDMECTLTEQTDLCFVGTVSFESDNLQAVDVFAVSNMLENRLFEALDSYKAFNVDGAEAGLYGQIDAGETSTPIAGIVVEDGSGFVLTPHGSSEEGYDFDLYQESFIIE